MLERFKRVLDIIQVLFGNYVFDPTIFNAFEVYLLERYMVVSRTYAIQQVHEFKFFN